MRPPTGSQWTRRFDAAHLDRQVGVALHKRGKSALGLFEHFNSRKALQNLNNNEDNVSVFTLRVGTVSGTSFTPMSSATGDPGAYVPLDYLTFVLDTPVTLAANTLYGFDWGSNNRGFVTVNNTDDNYTGGSAYSSGTGGAGDGNITLHAGSGSGTGDRIFHLDLTTRLIPEPSSAALLLFGVAMVTVFRRR